MDPLSVGARARIQRRAPKRRVSRGYEKKTGRTSHGADRPTVNLEHVGESSDTLLVRDSALIACLNRYD